MHCSRKTSRLPTPTNHLAEMLYIASSDPSLQLHAPSHSQLITDSLRVHFGGALLCLLGLSCIVVSDALDAVQAAKHGDDTDYPHAVWGDLLCISGAVSWGPWRLLPPPPQPPPPHHHANTNPTTSFYTPCLMWCKSSG